jgi:UDP-N-acetylmuramyl pentapeptide phosphotransferase/UDP-N-acetylglucosamine-1-phosphate transferase
LTGRPVAGSVIVVLAGSLAIATLGLLDDLRSIPIIYRLVGQCAIAIAVVALVGAVDRLPLPQPLDLPLGLLASPLTIAWLLTVTNFYNFMDGTDGLAGGQGVASCAGIAIAGWMLASGDVVLVVAASIIGFLFLNFPQARIFLGDVGSTSLGFLIGAFPLLAPATVRPAALFAVGIGLTLFLLDPLDTLFRLVRRGHMPGVAHREHSYQLLAVEPLRRNMVAMSIVLGGFVLSIAGALAFRIAWLAWPTLIVGVLLFGVERVLAMRVRGLPLATTARQDNR